MDNSDLYLLAFTFLSVFLTEAAKKLADKLFTKGKKKSNSSRDKRRR